MHSILNNHNRRLLDELDKNSGDQMKCLITVEEKGNAPWADDATQKEHRISSVHFPHGT